MVGLTEAEQLEVRGGGEGSQDVGFVEEVTLTLGALLPDDLTLWSVDLAPLEGREPVSGVFIVDTGARLTLHLNHLFIKQHSVEGTVPKVLELPAQVLGIGGTSRESVARITGLRVGEHEFREIVTSLSARESGGLETDDLAGLIGGDLLRRFHVFFDYGRREMTLEPNAASALPFRYDVSGLRLVSEGDDFMTVKAEFVLADSPAERAGVWVGDVLEKVDGIPVSGSTLDEVRRHLMQEGQQQVRLRRDQMVVDVALELEPLV